MKNDNPVISFIIPVYKVEEKYLRECICSLLAISNQKVEFIFIDDGSPDHSGDICEEYRAKDKRVIVIHKDNEGVSIARNKGIQVAKGSYISFIDADDWIDSEKMDEIISYVKKEEYDLYIYGQYLNYKTSEIEVAPFRENTVFKDEESCLELKKMLFVREYGSLRTDYRSGVVCNTVDKFIRRKIIIENQLWMKEGIELGEDNIFNLEVLFHCRDALYINICAYHYRMRLTSANHHGAEASGYRCLDMFWDCMIQLLGKYQAPKLLYEALNYRLFGLIFEQMNRSYVLVSDISLLKKCYLISKELNNWKYRRMLNDIRIRNLNMREVLGYVLLKLRMQSIILVRKEYQRRRGIEKARYY